jgi:predicted acyl esterase
VGVDGEDADFIARISDVYPDGRSILIADHPRRVSLRKSLNEPPVAPEPVMLPSPDLISLWKYLAASILARLSCIIIHHDSYSMKLQWNSK